MSNVVYLISSLPSLTFGQQVPLTLEEFENDAKNQLSENDFTKLKGLHIKNLSSCNNGGSLKTAIELHENLWDDMLEMRRANNERRSPEILNFPRKVVNKNPLEREVMFMKLLWDELTSIEAVESFTVTEVFVYKLKLQILDRLNSFDTEKGMEILDSVVNPSKNMEGEQ